MRRRRNSDGRRSLPVQPLAHIALVILVAGHSLAADSLRNGSVIKDGETLVSQGQFFELGFFSPGSSSRRYVGIWYKNIPDRTVVWVANRERPFSDATGMLTVDSAGNLMLLNGRGSPIVLASSPAEESAVALLRDDGNFVLAAASNRSRVFWQSFDHPTDTFLPGMRLGLRGRQNLLLTSWRDPEDPSPGDFEFGLDPGGTAQLLMWQRGQEYWTSGAWNGRGFSFVPEMTVFNQHIYEFVTNRKESYFTYSNIANASILSRFVLDYGGQFKMLVWLDGSQKWILFLSRPRGTRCDYPSACGGNGVCGNISSTASCRCLRGFLEPKWSWQQHSGYWSGGCERTLPLRCGEDDGFLRLRRVKLPVMFLGSLAIRSPTLNISDCNALCSKNCSCTAYASANTEGRGCLLWSGDLVGLQENVDGVQDLYVRLAASALDDQRGVSDKKKKPLLLMIIPAILTGSVVAFSCVIKCWLRRRKSKRKVLGEETNQELLFLEICRSGGKNYEHFSLHGFEKIAAATENFSDENKLGEGGFGPVYKGTLSEGQEIAVKRLSKRSGQGMEEFKTEILLIAKLQHRNLVRLLGCCIKGEERMLVYEYMPNKSLDYFLFDSARAAALDWGKRLHIIDGIAQGLLYLHKHSRMRIIHRDLKASNILLDNDMNPKISDFGMARISSPNDSEANTRRVVGTYGYMSPEYAMAGLFSVKSDVFSFGVLLLEIVSGKRNTAACQFTNSINLLGYAWTLWKEGRGMELMDATLCGSCVEAEFSRCVHVALLCIQEAAADRPTTSEIVVMLGNEHASLPTPKQPAFFTGREATDGDTPYPDLPMNNSLNHVTISEMDGR